MSVTGATISTTGTTMSTTFTTDTSAQDSTPNCPWDLNPSPTRLRAHNPAGFTRLYLVPPTHLTAPVESPQRHGDVTASLSLKTRVQLNLIRLFQLAVFFDDFFLLPLNNPAGQQEQEQPSDKLITIIEMLWDVDTPLGPDLMRQVLDHWYERHVDWWKANRRSKHAVGKGRELLLVNLADQYRRSRRYGVSRRMREASVDIAEVRGEEGIRDGDGDGEYHIRLLGSRVLQWKQVMFNCPGVVYERVLPVPPTLDGFMVDKGTAMAEHLIYRLLKAPVIHRSMALAQLVATDCSWVTLKDSDPAVTEMYRKLKVPKVPEKQKDQPTDDQTDPEETLCHETETEITEDDGTDVEDRDEPRPPKKRTCTEPSTQGDAATPDYDASGEDEELTGGTVLASVEDTEDESSDDEEETEEDGEEEEYDPDDEDDEDYED